MYPRSEVTIANNTVVYATGTKKQITNLSLLHLQRERLVRQRSALINPTTRGHISQMKLAGALHLTLKVASDTGSHRGRREKIT